ncbi:putative amino-acid permease protein YxeN [Sporomusa rhizae]|uniref:amino acid ABC transporter permease n=1 Tax=Sporomusa rhizae TaxID=357999 RepID=UPI00352B8C17
MGSYFSIDYMVKSFPILLSYVDVTIVVTIVAEVVGILLGSIVALIRINKIKALNQLCLLYISFIRGTPFLVQLYLVCFGLPQLLQSFGYQDIRSLPGLLFVFFIMAVHTGAYVAEIMRSSILAVDKGQLEAAHSIGMNSYQAYIRIIFPQAFSMAIPALGNNVISTLKGTSLIFNVGVVDMLRKADLMGSYSYRHLELYVDIAIIYVLLCFAIQAVTRFLERRTTLGKELAS